MSKRYKIAVRAVFVFVLMLVLAIVVWATLWGRTTLGATISTGYIDLQLNGGDDGAVFEPAEFGYLEPGRSVIKQLSVENIGEIESFYYEIYLDNLTGTLADATIINIYSYDTNAANNVGVLLDSFEATTLTESNSFTPSDNLLAAGESVDLWIEVLMEEAAGNVYQDTSLSFDIVASAVQSKNNP